MNPARRPSPRDRLALLAALLAAVLPLAAPAGAKGPVALEVCGAAACVSLTNESDPDAVYGIVDAEYAAPLDAFAPTPPLQPYFEARLVGEWVDGADRVYILPPAGLLRVGSGWIRLDDTTLAAVSRAVEGLEPYPSPRLTAAVVGGREAASAAPYEGLLAKLPPAEWPREVGERIAITLRFEPPGPWTGERLEYLRAHGILLRGAELWRLPEELVRTLAADAGTVPAGTPPPVRPGGGLDRDWLAGIGVAAVALAAALVAVRRARRRAPDPGGAPT